MPEVTVSPGVVFAIVAVEVTLLVGLVGLVRWLLPLFRRATQGLDAWEGYTDPSTGERRPGMVERMTHMERIGEATAKTAEATAQSVAEMAGRLTRVEESAAAAASAVVAVGEESERRHRDLSMQVGEVDRKVDQVAAEQTQIKAAVEELRRTQGTDATTTEGDPS